MIFVDCSLVLPMDAMPPNFCGEKFHNSHKNQNPWFFPQKFPTVRTVKLVVKPWPSPSSTQTPVVSMLLTSIWAPNAGRLMHKCAHCKLTLTIIIC